MITQGPSAADLSRMSPAELDALPFGAIELAPDGTVRSYNAGEAALSGRVQSEVVGLNFFTEVAPCTQVREFQGEFVSLVEHKAVNRHFDFTFPFKVPVRVSISMLYERNHHSVWVLVRRR